MCDELYVIVMTFWYVFGTDLLNFFELLFFIWD